MIVVRDIFQLKFGKTRDALAVMKEGLPMHRRMGMPENARILTDLVGNYYTMVLEAMYPSLAEYENLGKKMGGNKEWREWYEKLVALTESGRREIFNIVE